MTRFLDLNARLYAALLPLYPPGLRRDFGTEMAEVFAEDLDNAWRSRGIAGVIRVWLYSGLEILLIALPSHAANPVVAGPSIAFCLSVSTWSALLVLSQRSPGNKQGLFEAFATVVLLPSIIAAFMSFTVASGGREGEFGLLRLCSPSAAAEDDAPAGVQNNA
jgi:hypothetical protein